MKDALILVNLGAPEKPTESAARAFLRQFLSDSEILPLNFFLRNFIAWLVARKRAPKYAETLKRIFINGRHPLKKYTDSLTAKVARKLPQTRVYCAYRYGLPSIGSVIKQARSEGAKNFRFIALYPQNASSTTLSAKNEIFRHIKTGEDFKFVDSYCSHPAYISALAETLEGVIEGGIDAVMVSFHSVPLNHLKKTAYRRECELTEYLLKCATKFDNFYIAWQSKMKRGIWIEPSAEKVCADMLKDGVKKLAVICPGFSADCGETVIEIGEELKKYFLSNGGKQFILVPCLNDSDSHADMVCEIFKTML